MKNAFSALFLLLFLCMKAQLFVGSTGKILNNGTNTYFNVPVTGLSPAVLDSNFGLSQVCVNINHPAVQELYIYLESPNGETVELTEGSSCSGASYFNTCFENTAGSSVTLGTAPYTGSYRPIGYLGRFNNGQAGNGTWQLIVQDAVAFIDSGSVLSWSISFGYTPPKPVKFTSSNLPIVVINTNNQVLGDSTILVNMGIIDNGVGIRNNLTDPWNNYSGKTTIHIRGNSTRYFEKQSFNLQTSDASGNQLNVPLLGMPSDNDWDLVAPYQDKSLIRDPMTYDLYREMGHYSPRIRNVEVVINNEYWGIYVLQETLKQGKNRIDISKMTSAENSFPEVTGGYIVEIDRPGGAGSGWYSLLPGDSTPHNHFFYQYAYPKSTEITGAQQSYIQSVLDTFETVMNSPSYANVSSGYSNYVDVNSFIDFLILQEFSKNADAYRLSTYLYKDNNSNGGKLHIGPVWDFDIAWHNCNYGNAFSPIGWQFQISDTVYPMPSWWTRFMQDSNFVNNLYCRWNQLRQNILSDNNLYRYIDSSANALSESAPRNFTQWPVIGAYIWPNPQNEIGATYATELTDLKTWVANRLVWLDAVIMGHCLTPAGIKEIHPDPALTIYPNPTSSAFVVNYTINSNSKVKLEFFNAVGSKIIQGFEGNRVPGNYQEEIQPGNLSAGIYSVRLTIDDYVSFKKLIKLDDQ